MPTYQPASGRPALPAGRYFKEHLCDNLSRGNYRDYKQHSVLFEYLSGRNKAINYYKIAFIKLNKV